MSEIVLNDDLTKAIQDSLNPADIRTVVQAEIQKQGAAAAVAAADQTAAEKAAAAKLTEEQANTSTGFSRTETIGGREFTFEAESESELDRMVINAYRVADAVKPSVQETTPAVDPAVTAAAAQKKEEEHAVAMADLELKFKRGDISAQDYIEQSGAVDQYLEKKGVPINKLKETIEQNETRQEQQSWENATKEFLNGPAGSDWPGGEKNLELIGLIIASKPELINAEDKVAALAQAYSMMKSKGTIFPANAPAVSTTTTTDTPAPAVVPVAEKKAVSTETPAPVVKTAASSSSVFGASSGVSGSSGAPEKKTADQPVIDPNATPAEIMDAWKKSQIAAGKDPNTAFIDNFAAGRRS